LGVLHYAIITTKSNEDITNYIKEIVERIKKIMKKHNLKDFKLLKKDLQEKNQKKA
jgi:Holliday junction resolvasome RuvABC endonuclease subunit